MPPRFRIEPNQHDPLSETTVGRRLWAASLAAGYKSRLAFAAAIGIRHQTLSLIDTDKTTPTLDTFSTACHLVGYSMEEIYFGRKNAGREPNLSNDAIIAALDELEAEAPERAALKAHLDGPDAALQRVTRSYVTAFVNVHAQARLQKNRPPNECLQRAMSAADTARATSDAIAAGVRPPSRRNQHKAVRIAK